MCESSCSTPDLSWLLSGKDYFYATISAVIGALIGIYWTKAQSRNQKNQENEKIRVSILDSLRFNQERGIQAKAQLDGGGMPNYPLDGTRLSNLVVQAHGYLSPETLKNLDWHRFQLDHITAKLGVINDFYLSGQILPPEALDAHAAWMRMLRDSLIGHYNSVIGGTNALIQAVEEERQQKRA